MSIHDEVDRVLREGYRARNNVECAVMEIGRTAYGPQRRQAPLHTSYDAVTNWASLALVTFVGILALVGVGVLFGQTVLWLVRHG